MIRAGCGGVDKFCWRAMLPPMRNERSIARARAMRKEPTSAEEKLWGVLRAGRYRGIKFRRQHAIGRYVVDFACVADRLVIEVDGAVAR